MDRPVFGLWPNPDDRTTFEERTVYNLPLLEDFGDWIEFMGGEVEDDAGAASQSATTAGEKVAECQTKVEACQGQVTLAAQKVTDCQSQVTLATQKVSDCEGQVTLSVAAKTGAETARDKSSEWASKPAASGAVDDGVNTPDMSAKAYAVDDLKGDAGGSAKDWATADEDVEVIPGEFSSKHHAKKIAKGENLTATSSTSIEIGTGSKIFTLAESGRSFTGGSPIRISSQADLENNYMDGIVTDYDRDTDALTVNIIAAPGTGTHADWTIGLRAAGDARTLEGATLAQVRAGVTAGNVGLENVPNVNATDSANWPQGDAEIGDTFVYTAGGWVPQSVGSTPVGGIIMWSGSLASIPAKWALCDGTNSTPDLRNRFIIGAGDSYPVDNTGGSKDAVVVSHSHSHSLSVASAGSHTHTVSVMNSGGSTPGLQVGNNSSQSSTGSSGDHSHSMSGSIYSYGVSGADKNLPPYFALAYIMFIGE